MRSGLPPRFWLRAVLFAFAALAGMTSVNGWAQAGAASRSAGIAGFVRTPDGESLEGVTVIVEASIDNVVRTLDRTVTIAGGAYTLKDLSAGTYNLFVQGGAKKWVRYLGLTLADGEALRFDPTLQPDTVELDANPWRDAALGAITGRILNADGSPAIGLSVLAVPAVRGRPAGRLVAGSNQGPSTLAPSMVSSITKTDRDGNYRLEKLPQGPYSVATGILERRRCPPNASCLDLTKVSFAPYVSAPTYFPPAPDSVLTVVPGVTTRADFRLPAPVGAAFRLTGRILGRISFPKARELKLVAAGGDCRSERNRPAPAAEIPGGITSDGYFELRNVPAGSYVLCLRTQSGWLQEESLGTLAVSANISDITVSLR